MEYALERRASADGYYRTADHMGRCVMSFIQARNAFAGMLQIMFKPTGSRSWYESSLLADKTMIWSLCRPASSQQVFSQSICYCREDALNMLDRESYTIPNAAHTRFTQLCQSTQSRRFMLSACKLVGSCTGSSPSQSGKSAGVP